MNHMKDAPFNETIYDYDVVWKYGDMTCKFEKKL